MLPHKPIVPDFSNGSPRLYTIQNGYNRSTSSKVDEVELLRKTMHIEAMVQRSWIGSMVVPGLGQVYNKDYWKVPCFYLGFALVGHRIYSEHQEMNKHKRDLLINGGDKPNPAYTEKRIQECKRTRDLFIIIASAWYLLSILDAYAGGHDKTVNFKDDIGTKSTSKSTAVLQPTATTSIDKRSLPQ
ncbi:DUF5683 domain-containing protein [Cardinium endosymbiont of Oedothorax gibbosus]|uniref:DUF5683 domain-containing protein n=1 Tax=Cardinium endosymbiont of Oedothorax gibbosus TaxID=931101 RepID=UPI002024A86D|nr:DUF5683 domain-containing protein [Cardinium endosymbiont of Oedothorax gibbosus]